MRFTVLTPTYNRAHLLPRVYESLCVQTFKNFEWLIVDDGSSDETGELIKSWSATFPIRYFWKNNTGMHTALNLGIKAANGEFITQLDSDDLYIPEALEIFDNCWKQITHPERFACVIALCYGDDGQLLGSQLPTDYVDTFTVREYLSLIDADRCSIMRTDVCREFPFPEFPGERFIVPGLVYNRMAAKYANRFVNEPLKIVGYETGHMSSNKDMRWSNPRGAVVYHVELALSDAPLKVRLKSAINALRFSVLALISCIPMRRLIVSLTRLFHHQRTDSPPRNQNST